MKGSQSLTTAPVMNECKTFNVFIFRKKSETSLCIYMETKEIKCKVKRKTPVVPSQWVSLSRSRLPKEKGKNSCNQIQPSASLKPLSLHK